jgi:hypothetical protein
MLDPNLTTKFKRNISFSIKKFFLAWKRSKAVAVNCEIKIEKDKISVPEPDLFGTNRDLWIQKFCIYPDHPFELRIDFCFIANLVYFCLNHNIPDPGA